MFEACYRSPIGYIRLTEEDGFITTAQLLDGDYEMNLPATPLLQCAIDQLHEYFNGTRQMFDLPVKQKGSPFQQKVWEQLSMIGYGKTLSYARQSQLMNSPLSIRAIASANGKNNLMIIVPCHRVIGSNGDLTGFACGLWRKKWLLEHEAKVTGAGQTKLEL